MEHIWECERVNFRMRRVNMVYITLNEKSFIFGIGPDKK